MKNNFIYTCIIYKMSGLQFTYRYPGPPSQGLLIKNRGNNAIINAQMGMPQKFSPSAGDSLFSNCSGAGG